MAGAPTIPERMQNTMKTLFHSALLTFLMLAAGTLGSPALADDSTPMAFDQILERYEVVRLALIHDTTDGVSDQGKEIETILAKLSADWSPAAAGIRADMADDVRGLLPELSEAAAALSRATSLDAARDAFYELSKPLVRWRKAADGSTAAKSTAAGSTEAQSTAASSTDAGGWPTVAYCSMARRSWLQPEGELGNPYYGQSMLRCGETVDG